MHANVVVHVNTSTNNTSVVNNLVRGTHPCVSMRHPVSVVYCTAVIVSCFICNGLGDILVTLVRAFVVAMIVNHILRDDHDTIRTGVVASSPSTFGRRVIAGLGRNTAVVGNRNVFANSNGDVVVTIVGVQRVGRLVSVAHHRPGSFICFKSTANI